MDKDIKKSTPGDGLRSLRSTLLFRAVNYELYAKPNKFVMLVGIMAMLGCSGYILYMRQIYKETSYGTTDLDGSSSIKRKSKWID